MSFIFAFDVNSLKFIFGTGVPDTFIVSFHRSLHSGIVSFECDGRLGHRDGHICSKTKDSSVYW